MVTELQHLMLNLFLVWTSAGSLINFELKYLQNTVPTASCSCLVKLIILDNILVVVLYSIELKTIVHSVNIGKTVVVIFLFAYATACIATGQSISMINPRRTSVNRCCSWVYYINFCKQGHVQKLFFGGVVYFFTMV